jgi:SAM-dependent methyltransferase
MNAMPKSQREYRGMDSHIEWPTAELAALVGCGVIAPTARFLDVGAGLGTEAIMLARLGCEVVALDDDIEARRECLRRVDRAEVRDRVRVPNGSKCDALRYREPRSGTFDGAIDRLMLHNLATRNGLRLVRTFAYALKLASATEDGGVLVLRTRLDREGEAHDLIGNWGPVQLSAAIGDAGVRRELKRYFSLGPPVQFAGLVSDPLQTDDALVITTLPMAIIVGRRNDVPFPRS